MHVCARSVYQLFRALFKDAELSNDVPFNWVAALLECNEIRVQTATSHDIMSAEMEQMASSEVGVPSASFAHAEPVASNRIAVVAGQRGNNVPALCPAVGKSAAARR